MGSKNGVALLPLADCARTFVRNGRLGIEGRGATGDETRVAQPDPRLIPAGDDFPEPLMDEGLAADLCRGMDSAISMVVGVVVVSMLTLAGLHVWYRWGHVVAGWL